MPNSEKRREIERQYAQLTARAWSDESFKQKLLSDPVEALKEAGIEVPAGKTVRVLENTDTEFNIVLKQRPKALTAEQLDEVVGGGVSCLATECDTCATE